MRRDRDEFPGEDGCINRMGNPSRNVFPLIGAALTMLKRLSTLMTEVIELDQPDRGVTLRPDS